MRKYSFYLKLMVSADTHDDALELATLAMDASDIREQDGIINVELIEDVDDMDDFEEEDDFDFEDEYDDVDYEDY
jgi:hypothetical protein